MKISLFYEPSIAPPYERDREYQMFQNALEQIELADSLGYHTIWAVEHHFLEQFAHLSAPEVFLAAVSQRTKNIRLGHGIVQLLPKINDPIRVAERIATLDLISGGRVEFGSGEGASAAELGGFGVDKDLKRGMWEEGLDVAIKALTEEPFAGYDGEYVSYPPRNVMPKPYQRPHPPLWVATSRRESITRVARLGAGALGFFWADPEVARAWVEHYFETFAAEAVPIGEVPNPSFALNVLLFAAPTREQALERFGPSVELFGYTSSHYYRDGTHEPGKTNIADLLQAEKDAASANGAPEGAQIAAATDPDAPTPIGTADDVRRILENYEGMNVDEILLMPQAGFLAEHEHVMESIEIIGKEVLPDFHRRHELDAPARERRKAEMCENALARKETVKREIPEGYSFGVAETGLKATLDEFYRASTGEASEHLPESDSVGSKREA